MNILRINTFENMSLFDRQLCEFVLICYNHSKSKKILDSFSIVFDLGNAVFLNFKIKGDHFSLKINEEDYVKSYDNWCNNKSFCIFTVAGKETLGFNVNNSESPIDNYIPHIKTPEERKNELINALLEAYEYKKNNIELYTDKTIKGEDEIKQMYEVECKPNELFNIIGPIIPNPYIVEQEVINKIEDELLRPIEVQPAINKIEDEIH